MVISQVDLTGQSKSCIDFVSVINSDQFKTIRENYEEKFNKYDNKVHLKKDEHIKSLMQQAEEKMKGGEYKVCTRLYNEALLQATHPSVASTDEERSIFCKIIFSRSMAFHNLEYYEEYLKDYETLMYYCENELTKEQIENCTELRNACKAKLDEALENIESDLKLNLKAMKSSYNESKVLYGMSENISMTYDSKTGRGLIANKKLNENELISIQKPFVSVLSPTLYKKNCYNCLIKLSKFGYFFPCRNCTEIRYCSYKCEMESWTEFHQHECTYLDLLNYSNTFHFQPKLALKLVLKCGIENVLNNFNKKPNDQPVSLKKKNKKKNNKANQQKVDYSTMNYDAICSLQDQAANCPNFSPPITLILLFLTQRFKTLTMNEISILGCVLLRHLQQIHTNSKYILSKELKPETSNRHSDLLLLSDVKIGCALFQTFSLINHDCEPNVISFCFRGDQLYLKTLREIKAGEQINISYGCNWKWNTYNARQEFLSKFYFFDCECNSCVNRLNPVSHALKCEKCSDNSPVFPIKHTKYDAKCNRCQTMFANRFETVKCQTQSSVELLEKVKLLFEKGDDTDFKKIKIILNDIKDKFEKVFYKYNQKLQLVEQHLSICCKLLNELEESVEHAEKALEIISQELNEHYSNNFNSLIKLIDRQVMLFRACSENPKNLDHLKLDYLRNLKKGKVGCLKEDVVFESKLISLFLYLAKQWLDVNLIATSDEYMYYLSFLSLSFSSYTNLGKTSSKEVAKEIKEIKEIEES